MIQCFDPLIKRNAQMGKFKFEMNVKLLIFDYE